jgi:hypothetical protein
MSDAPDEVLKRAFAQAPVVGPDENFVAALSADVAARRTRRRLLVGACGATGILVLALALALLAPTEQLSATGLSLLQLPERLGELAPATSTQWPAGGWRASLPTGAWLYLMLALCVLPLAAAPWIVRRILR